jgi:geranylgeranyl diphosphate synthase type II
MNESPLDYYLRARRTEVDDSLMHWLPTPPDAPPAVASAMRYSVEAGGKRLRPILCLAAAETVATAAGSAVEEARRMAMPAACAIEMIHTYSLVHDDLPAMDDDTLRRGRPTLHMVAGEGMAILAGDGLLTEAFALLAQDLPNQDASTLSRRMRTIRVIATAAGASGMVGGQALDLNAAPRPGGPPPLTAKALRVMHGKKTGALITASAVAGAIMAGATASAESTVTTAGQQLGLAFQIVDDILDVEGTSANIGKTAGKDTKAGKPTYPALFGVAESRRLAHDCVTRANAALEAAGFASSRLTEIGQWIVERTN